MCLYIKETKPLNIYVILFRSNNFLVITRKAYILSPVVKCPEDFEIIFSTDSDIIKQLCS